MRLLQNDINIETIAKALSLYHQAILQPEPNRVLLEDIACYLELDTDRNRIRLTAFFSLQEEYSMLEMLAFCNEMNGDYMMLTVTFLPVDRKGIARLIFRYNMVYTSEIDLAQLIQNVTRFNRISDEIIENFKDRYPEA